MLQAGCKKVVIPSLIFMGLPGEHSISICQFDQICQADWPRVDHLIEHDQKVLWQAQDEKASDEDTYRAGDVEQGVHLHQVVLDGRPRDNDAQSSWHLLHLLHQLHLGILQLVPLQSPGLE